MSIFTNIKDFFVSHLSPKSKEILSGQTTFKEEAKKFAQGVAVAGAIATTIAAPISAVAKVAVIGAGIPLGTGILTSSPKIAETIKQTPSSIQTFGENIGGAVQNPSIASLSKVIKDSPYLSAITIAGAGLAAAKTIVPFIQTHAINQQTEAIRDAGGKVPMVEMASSPQVLRLEVVNPSPVVSSEALPQEIETPTKKKAKKKSTKKKAKKKSTKKKAKKKSTKKKAKKKSKGIKTKASKKKRRK